MRSVEPLLSVRDLSVRFGRGEGTLQALDGVSFDVTQGEMLALVGESGCGKSVAMMAVLGLLPRRGVEVTASRIMLDGIDLRGATRRTLRQVRGGRIGMVFQDPMTSLNPVHRIGDQISETLHVHEGLRGSAVRARVRDLLDLVRIPDAARRIDSYPHELSGGMRQRVMIAMALACRPDLLIADEPTTALDVTVQAQIMELIATLRSDLGMSVILVSHDLGLVAASADRVAVMYAGRIVEQAPVAELFRAPSHGYTAGLLMSLPDGTAAARSRLAEIPGTVPRLSKPLPACAFAPRCRFAEPACTGERPPLLAVGPGHLAACRRVAAVAAALSDHPVVKEWT